MMQEFNYGAIRRHKYLVQEGNNGMMLGGVFEIQITHDKGRLYDWIYSKVCYLIRACTRRMTFVATANLAKKHNETEMQLWVANTGFALFKLCRNAQAIHRHIE